MDPAVKSEMLDSAKPKRKVLGVDINIRKHNRAAIDAHPLRKRIKMIQGSSKDQIVINQVKEVPQGFNRVIVSLDSIHTHTHVGQSHLLRPVTAVVLFLILL